MRQHRIDARADLFQQLPRGVGDPFTDCQERGGSGQDRACGQRECDDQGVAHSAWIARVGDLGELFQEAGNLPGRRWVMFAELVKGMRDQR